MVDVDTKTVRKWINGEVPMPGSVLLGLPTDIALDLLDRLSSLRGAEGNGMSAQIERLRRSRDLDAIHAAQDELTAIEREIVRSR